MIHGTPRDANSFSPVPSAARPSRTARLMLFSFIDRTRLPSRSTESMLRPVTPSSGSQSAPVGELLHLVDRTVRTSRGALAGDRPCKLQPLWAHPAYVLRPWPPHDAALSLGTG